MLTLRQRLLLPTALLLLASCTQSTPSPTITSADPPLQQLIAGNARFAAGHPLHQNQSPEHRVEKATGQHPIAIIVGCSDSRVPPEIVFDQGLGDLFVVRTAGNVVDDQALGSIEYAVEHLHTHLLIVLGHDSCGAVVAAISGGETAGHIGSITSAIAPAVEKAKTEPGDLLDNAVNENVLRVVNQLKSDEPLLSHAAQSGDLTILGARYNLAPGTIQWLTTP